MNSETGKGMKLFYYMRRFWEIPGVEKILLIKALILYTIIKLISSIVNIKYIIQLIKKRSLENIDSKYIKSNKLLVLKTIRRISKFSHWYNNCLIKVITTKIFLNKYCIESQIILSIKMKDGSILGAHAYLYLEDNTLFLKDKRFKDAFRL